jgi:iron complex transport system substrate-binding protein
MSLSSPYVPSRKVKSNNFQLVTPGVGMRFLVLFATVVFGFVAFAADTRVVVDSAGRRVKVPAKIERVFAAGGPAGVFLYTLAPEKLLNWNLPLTAEQRAYLPGRYGELPALGRLTGRGNTASVETVLAARPDVILDYGTINPTYASLADRIQKQTGVPYLLFDGAFDKTAAIYKSAGIALGVGERAEQLSRYTERLLADVDKRLARVPVEKRPLVYYARGLRGLQTGLKGSINVESIERIGARNVAAERIGQGSLVSVSPEQLLMWNPEIVITAEAAFAPIVAADDVWKSIKAVRSGRVYVAPTLPFPWIDSPPSVNRLIGLKWLGGIFYPDLFPENLRNETRNFYSLFYHRAPNDWQLNELLSGAVRVRQ